MSIELSADEQTRLEAMLQELLARGYQQITEHRNLRIGTRIRHHGHQWTEAFRSGTGYVAALTEKPDSAWSAEWGMPDIELIAVWDKPWPFDDSSRLSQVAQYHVHAIQEDQ